MRKFVMLFLAGIILGSIFFPGSALSAEDENKEELKEEGYQLTSEDKRTQLISVCIFLILIAFTI